MSELRAMLDGLCKDGPLWSFPGGLDQLEPPLARGYRLMLAGFGHWLATRQGVASPDPQRCAHWLSLGRWRADVVLAVEGLADELREEDVVEALHPFARRYLGGLPGNLSSDWWQCMVVLADRCDLTEVQADAAEITAFCDCIDRRLQQFESDSPALWEPLQPELASVPAWSGSVVADWLADLECCTTALADARPSMHRLALLRWWAVVDAAPAFQTTEVVSALALTRRRIADAGVQQAVERALSQFPGPIVIGGLLPVLPALVAQCDAAGALLGSVSVPRTYEEQVAMQLALRDAPAAQRAIFLQALAVAADEDDGQCARLQTLLGPTFGKPSWI